MLACERRGPVGRVLHIADHPCDNSRGCPLLQALKGDRFRRGPRRRRAARRSGRVSGGATPGRARAAAGGARSEHDGGLAPTLWGPLSLGVSDRRQRSGQPGRWQAISSLNLKPISYKLPEPKTKVLHSATSARKSRRKLLNWVKLSTSLFKQR